MDLLDSLFDEEPTRLELNEQQDKILNQYLALFEHGIPFAYIPNSVSTEKIFIEMEKCIEDHTDNLLERLGITIKESGVY